MVLPDPKEGKGRFARSLELLYDRRKIHSALGHRTPHGVRARYMDSQFVARTDTKPTAQKKGGSPSGTRDKGTRGAHRIGWIVVIAGATPRRLLKGKLMICVGQLR